MTRVEFYIVDADSPDARLKLACTLCDEAMRRRDHVFIHCALEAEARKLDELLWTFSQGSFIPHRIVQHAAAAAPKEPVLIGVGVEPIGDRWDILINLAPDVPDFFSRYRRVAELVDGDATRREQSRARYRYYRERGYELSTHQM